MVLATPTCARAAVSLAKVGDFAGPTYVTAPPGDTSRVFVVEQGGTIRVIRDGVLQSAPFADLTARVLSGGERGLLSIAFAPDYATTGLFYAYFTNKNGDIQIDELRRADADHADAAYARTVLTVPHPGQSNHNGGQLQFGPDGRLYAGTGDGGGGGDPDGNAQNDAKRLGKLLQLDLNGGAINFAKGLRNPWRFSFDRSTGDVIIADVGQNAVEEVDFAAAPNRGAGANYGWDRYEGNTVYDTTVTINGPVVSPVLTHTHSDGWCSITGGYVVRDPDVPELLGRYVYSDYCKGALYSATLPGATDDAPVGVSVPSTSSFGEDASGRVYVASLNGPVYRIAGSGRPGGTPATGTPPTGTTPAPSTGSALTGRVLSLSIDGHRRLRLTRTRRIRLGVRCSAPCVARIRSAVFGAKARTFTRRLPGGRTLVLFTLTKRQRIALGRSLRHGRRPNVSIRVTTAATVESLKMRVVR